MVQHQGKEASFIDREFSHEGISEIDGQEVEWLYIQPCDTALLFPEAEDERTWEGLDQVELVAFLKCIYSMEPNLIKRIFEPPVHNVYSVWLFLNGCFEPVFVDGYFPLDSQLNHFYGNSGSYLWLPVLIKCLCKVFNTLSKEKLSQIDPLQVYRMLTGLKGSRYDK